MYKSLIMNYNQNNHSPVHTCWPFLFFFFFFFFFVLFFDRNKIPRLCLLQKKLTYCMDQTETTGTHTHTHTLSDSATNRRTGQCYPVRQVSSDSSVYIVIRLQAGQTRVQFPTGGRGSSSNAQCGSVAHPPPVSGYQE
jgi:hypothetical protein